MMNHFEKVVNLVQERYGIVRISNIRKRDNVFIYEGKITDHQPDFASKHVAVKIQRQDSDPLKDILNQEARVYSYLRHKNIVRIEFTTTIKVSESENYRCLVMEFVEGYDLKDILSKLSLLRKKMAPAAFLSIIREILEGIIYIHQCKDENNNNLNIVHRDISLENIMITQNGEVKILDFGIALLGNKSLNRIAGKPDYMSPEQLKGENVDHRTDLFAIGLIFLELIVGHKVKTKNRNNILESKSIDPFIKKIIIKAISEDKENRYKDGDEFLKDIETYISKNKIQILSGELRKFMKEDLHDDSQTTIFELPEDISENDLPQKSNFKLGFKAILLILSFIISSLLYINRNDLEQIFTSQSNNEPVQKNEIINPTPIVSKIKYWTPEIKIQSENANINVSTNDKSWKNKNSLLIQFDRLKEGSEQKITLEIKRTGYRTHKEIINLSYDNQKYTKAVILDKKEKGSITFTAEPWAIINAGEYRDVETPFKGHFLEGSLKITAKYENDKNQWITVNKNLVINPKENKNCFVNFEKNLITCK